jgi:hypothetical protein
MALHGAPMLGSVQTAEQQLLRRGHPVATPTQVWAARAAKSAQSQSTKAAEGVLQIALEGG